MNGKQLARNSFAKGMAVDMDESLSRPDSIEEAWEVRLLNEDGAGLVATNRRGTEHISSIPEGFRCLAIRQLGGVAYLILGQTDIHGELTGTGEIGTFPSPDPDDDSMDMRYRPLMNYGGDTGADDTSRDGRFRSALFAFPKDCQMDLELQPDYDGTVNLIFTDGVNPMRIVNSGFSVIPGGKYASIKRDGRQTNRYTRHNFEDTLQLIARSSKIMKLHFKGVQSGGRVKGGNYTYYFAYTTADGARTEIQNVSRMVSVFKGNTAAAIQGAEGDGEDTGKSVVFQLDGLDESYSFLEISFVLNYGQDDPAKRAYRIDKLYPLKGNTLRFVHSGLEPTTEIQLSELSEIFTPIDTAGALAQMNNHLIVADIKEKSYDLKSLKAFAHRIAIGHKEILLDNLGSEEGLSRTFTEGMDQENLKKGTGGWIDGTEQDAIKKGIGAWNGGYYNPKNIYERLGYFGGEAYPFGICFIFPGNWVSPPFPLLGGDNKDNDRSATIEGAAANELLFKKLSQGEFDPASKTNGKGIYRFPNRNAAGVGELLKGGTVTVNGVTFRIPLWDSKEFVEVRKHTIGCFFVRGDRNKDLITQGVIINTVQIPLEDKIKANEPERKLWNYQQDLGGYDKNNSKVIPAYDYHLESIKICKQSSSETRSHEGLDGIYACHFNTKRRETFDRTHFAFLSGDVFCRPSVFSEVLHENDLKMVPLKRVTMRYDIPTGSLYDKHFSLLRPISTVNETVITGPREVKTSWVVGATNIPNGQNFASEARFSAENPVVDGIYHYSLFTCKFNPYVGLKAVSGFALGNPSTAENAVEVKKVGKLGLNSTGAMLVNLYGGENGQYKTEDLAGLYSVMSDVAYTQISERMYWDELNKGVDAGRKLTVYGGDCFVMPVYRRLYYNSESRSLANETAEGNVGYTICYVGENSEHPAMRFTHTEDISELAERPVYPKSAIGGTAGDKFATGNNWRELRIPESTAYNKGYGITRDDRFHVSLPENAPFIQRRWPAGVAVSASHSSGSFENGFRLWTGMNMQNYDSSLGRIVRMVPLGDGLLAVQERGIGLMGLQERIQTGSDTAGAIFIEAPAFLPPKMKIVSGRFGAERKGMVLATDGHAYGFSLGHMAYWRIGPDGFQSLADFNIKSRLRDKFAPFTQLQLYSGKAEILLHWDSDKHEVWLTGYSAKDSFSLIYHEQLRLFEGFTKMAPCSSVMIGPGFYSFAAVGDLARNYIYLHESAKIPFGSFYGQQSNLRLRFIVNQHVDLEKLFENLQLVGNRCMPIRITYWVDGAESVQQISYDPLSRARSNARPGGGCTEVIIPKVAAVTERSASQRFTAEEEFGSSRLGQRSRMKGKSLVVELEYSAEKLLRLQSVLTTFQPVFI